MTTKAKCSEAGTGTVLAAGGRCPAGCEAVQDAAGLEQLELTAAERKGQLAVTAARPAWTAAERKVQPVVTAARPAWTAAVRKVQLAVPAAGGTGQPGRIAAGRIGQPARIAAGRKGQPAD